MTTATRGRVITHPECDEIRLEDVLHALADPVRMLMVRQLAASEDPLPCSALDVPVSKSTGTHHFRVLRQSGVVQQVYRGTARMSTLRRNDLDALFPGLLETMLDAAARQSDRTGAT